MSQLALEQLIVTQTQHHLNAILAGDLEFHSDSSAYASHSLHAFAAKFPPQLPRTFIESLTEPGDTILDPFVGSGTTLVEAFLLGRLAVGVDIDPLARMICRVKTLHLPGDVSLAAGMRVLEKARCLEHNQKYLGTFFERFDAESRAFVDYWFLPTTQREIASLLLAIEEEADPKLQEFLLLVLSSIIITKSGGISLARDLAHSRPHKDKTKVPRSGFAQFQKSLAKSARSLNELPTQVTGVTIQEGDARLLPLPDASVDLIVTSPPYANAIDYMRAHKFSLVWLGHSISFLGEHRSRYIGAERIDIDLSGKLPQKTTNVLATLGALDAKKQRIVRKYFLDMQSVLMEMWRVLRRDTASIIVVGPSIMRNFTIPTHECLAEIGGDLGFNIVGIAQRRLDRNRRMMPARFQKNDSSMIEQRMHDEYVVALHKP
ncbi:MAG TPA: DNA methyltransferase [Chthonomonadaceae bacterium]|nr:DNA methyltransferase [Chthonomonadaceae bacterium]